jgi:hypothetical protein
VPKSILETLPLSEKTKRLQSTLQDRLSDGIFARIRNNVGFHYSKKQIDINSLKPTLTGVDSHFFVNTQGAIGFTLSRLSTLALFETILREVPSSSRAEAMEEIIKNIFNSSRAYSDFITGVFIDLVKAEFGTVPADVVVIPDAPTLDDEKKLLHFFHSSTNWALVVRHLASFADSI